MARNVRVTISNTSIGACLVASCLHARPLTPASFAPSSHKTLLTRVGKIQHDRPPARIWSEERLTTSKKFYSTRLCTFFGVLADMVDTYFLSLTYWESHPELPPPSGSKLGINGHDHAGKWPSHFIAAPRRSRFSRPRNAPGFWAVSIPPPTSTPCRTPFPTSLRCALRLKGN